MKSLLFAALMMISISAAAQNDPQKLIDEFFTLYKNKGVEASVDYLFGSNKWMAESKEQIENIKFKLNTTVVKSMGNFHGQNLITKKTIGENVVLYTYLRKLP